MMWGEWCEGEFNDASVGSRSCTGDLYADVEESSGLPNEAVRIVNCGPVFFLKDKPISVELVLRPGSGFGGGFGLFSKSLGNVGARAPNERRCFVEIPLLDGISEGGIRAIFACGFVG